MFLIDRHAKNEFFKDQNQNKEIHKFKISTVQEHLIIFFGMRKYLKNFFLICEIFIDFFNKCVRNIIKLFAWRKNYCKVFNMFAKIVIIF